MPEAEAARVAAPVDGAGLGCLRTTRGNLPLDRLDVRAAVTGLVSRVELTQDFVNVHGEPLEATYVFPLPDRAALTGMRMTADGRVVEAELQERGAARETYDKAIAAGQRASIAEEERPDVFTMRVGNILPGERVSVALTLVGPLSYEDDEATFRFPLVVAPRYVPGNALPQESVGDGHAMDTDAVPDASRITPPVLLPGFPHPVKLSIEVDVDPAGLPLRDIRSSLHQVTTEDNHISVRPGERADRDFVLRFGYGAAEAAAALSVTPDAGGEEGTYRLTVLPPDTVAAGLPRDVVLLLDRSGSMTGWKMVAARRAAARIVDTLGAGDRFAVLAFDDQVEFPPDLGTGLVAATDRHRYRAVEHLARMDARGGTELLRPLQDALRLLTTATAAPAAAARDKVLVLVTDGQVGNEDQILREAGAGLADVRVHTVGIDRAVNAGFLGRLAAVGGGRCELVESEDRLDEAMDRIHRRIGSPVITGVSISTNGLSLVDGTATPARVPDVFPGVPFTLAGRYRGAGAGSVTLHGTTRDGQPWSATATAQVHDNPALTAIWARAMLRDLEDAYVALGYGDTVPLEDRITRTSLRFGVLCRFTAYVAVDSRVVTDGGQPRKIIQPVELPSGWEPQAARPPHAPMMVVGAAMPFARESLSARMTTGYAGGAPKADPYGSIGGGGGGPAGPGGPPQSPVPLPAAPAYGSPPPAPASDTQPPKRRKESTDEEKSEIDVRSVRSVRRRHQPAAEVSVPDGAPARVIAAETAALLAREAVRLRAGAGRADYERVEMLEDLGSRLAALAVPALAELVGWLSPERIRQQSLAEVWTRTLAALDALASGGPVPASDAGAATTGPGAGKATKRAAFWKR
jgi:hypothetical protein